MRLHVCICTPTPVCIYMYMHTYIQTLIYAYSYIYAHAHIHAYMHTHMRIHVHAHLYTNRKSQQQCLNASNNITDAHTLPCTYACMYTSICIYTYVRNLQRMSRCHRCVRQCQKNICIAHTTANALVLRTPVLKCTQHSLQKNAHIYSTYIHTYAYAYTSTRKYMHIYDTVQTR